MAGRDDLVYDEDDYVPPGYVPPKRAGNRTKQFVVVAIVGVLVGAVLLMYVMRSRERTRFVQIESDRARQNAVLAANQRVAQASAGEAPGSVSNWSKLIGVWSRASNVEKRDNLPFRFDFRANETATVTHLDDEGKPVSGEWRVRIVTEEIELGRVTLELQNRSTSAHRYLRFTIQSDRTVLLDDPDGPKYIVFTREK